MEFVHNKLTRTLDVSQTMAKLASKPHGLDLLDSDDHDSWDGPKPNFNDVAILANKTPWEVTVLDDKSQESKTLLPLQPSIIKTHGSAIYKQPSSIFQQINRRIPSLQINCFSEVESRNSVNLQVIPEHSASREMTSHKLLDSLQMNEINLKEYLQKPKEKSTRLVSLLKKRSL